MQAVREVGEIKRRRGLPVLDAGREAVVLDRIQTLAGPELASAARPLYRTMMAAARRLEMSGGASSVRALRLTNCRAEDFFLTTTVLAVWGVVPERMNWCASGADIACDAGIPEGLIRDLREHGIGVEEVR